MEIDGEHYDNINGKRNSKLILGLMILYPFYILLISYIGHSNFNVGSNTGFPGFISYVIVIGITPLLIYIARWYLKGIVNIDKYSTKVVVILLYAISFTMFLLLLLGYFMKKYNIKIND